MGESGFLCHEPCPKCGSPDNMARYEDGHAHCFTEGCGYHEPPSGEASLAPQKAQSKIDSKFLSGEYAELTKRCLTLETCQKWGYQVGVYRGRGGEKPCQIANYRRDGRVVFQKIRFPDKGFKSIGDIEQAGLYGQHLWSGGRMIVITEGEIDAMSVSQVQNHRWPVVSIPNGVGGAVKALRREISWLEKFETIVLMFDMDEPGQEAAKKCALLFTPGKVRIAHLPLKDPNEMLQEGRGAELIQAIWNAKEYRPDGIVDGKSTWELYKAKKNVPSTPYPWPCFNQKTHGMRLGEIVTFTAGSGIGKSTVCRELAHYLLKCGERVGYIALEESVGKSTEALMSIECNTPLHLHPDKFTEPELFEIWKKVFDNDRIYLYDHWGSIDIDNLLNRLTYLVKGCGCKWLFLDHISIVVSGIDDGDERRLIDNLMTALRSFVEATGVGLFIVSHLKRTDQGKSHEEGGRVTLGQLRGSQAIAQLSDLTIALERNQQDEEVSNISTVRVLKNRFSGQTGVCGSLRYVESTGRLVDASNPFDEGKGEF